MKKMTDKELYNLCQKYGSNARMWRRKFEALLPEVEKRKLYKKRGFHSIHEFAAKLAGLGNKTVDEVLRVHRKLEDKPLLKEQIAKHGYAKIRAVTPLVEKEDEQTLVNMIETLPRGAIEETVREIKKEENPTCKSPTCWDSEPVTLSFKIDSKLDFRFREFQQELEKEKKEKLSFNEVLENLLDIAATTKKPKQTRISKGVKKITRYIPASKKRELQKQCVFPSCNKPATAIHHPERFAITKNHKRLVPLCKKHHQIAHAGLIDNENKPPENWKIRKQPDETSAKFKIDQKFLQFQLC